MDASLKERPTINYLKQVLTAYDSKMDFMNQSLNEQVVRLDQALDNLDKEFDGYDAALKDFRLEVATKLSMEEGKKIWDHFQRFAEYQDLKDLYKKCIPQLAKFEQKMMDFKSNYERMEDVVVEFDKHMLTKANKM